MEYHEFIAMYNRTIKEITEQNNPGSTTPPVAPPKLRY